MEIKGEKWIRVLEYTFVLEGGLLVRALLKSAPSTTFEEGYLMSGGQIGPYEPVHEKTTLMVILHKLSFYSHYIPGIMKSTVLKTDREYSQYEGSYADLRERYMNGNWRKMLYII